MFYARVDCKGLQLTSLCYSIGCTLKGENLFWCQSFMFQHFRATTFLSRVFNCITAVGAIRSPYQQWHIQYFLNKSFKQKSNTPVYLFLPDVFTQWKQCLYFNCQVFTAVLIWMTVIVVFSIWAFTSWPQPKQLPTSGLEALLKTTEALL